MSSRPSSKQPFPWITPIIILIAISILLGLATWQVKRLAWKEALINQIETAYEREAKNFEPQKTYQNFDKVKLGGVFMDRVAFVRAKTYEGKIGYHLIMPLKTEHGVIFVNRGWAEKDSYNAPKAFTKFEAVLRTDEKSNGFIPDNVKDGAYLYWPEISALESIFNVKSLGPMVAWQIPTIKDLASEPFPVGNKPVLKNDHLQYAMFWATMAFILVAIGVMKIRAAKEES